MELSENARGRAYRIAADTVTYTRTAVGTYVALNILTGDRLLPKKLRHRSVGAAAGVAVLGAMDKLDGVLARKAEAAGVEITRKDREKDPIEDKKFNRRMMGAIAIREAISGAWDHKKSRIAFAGLVGLNLLLTEDRDMRMGESRANAVEGADTSAIWINKLKTGTQNVAHTLASSPLANTAPGQAMIGMVYSASTAMGEIGFRIADKIHRGEGMSPAEQQPSPYNTLGE